MKSELLRLIRECKNKIELSRKSGVAINTINNWLRKGIIPTVDNAEKVLNALGYKIEIKKKDKEN